MATAIKLDKTALRRHHIPVADNRAFYIIALEGGNALGALLTSEMPSEAELQLLRHYQLFMLSPERTIYNEGWTQKQLAMIYPGNDGHNTQVFVKAEDGWRYRSFTWAQDATYWPHMYGEGARSMTLMQLLDFIERDMEFDRDTDDSRYVEGKKWADYKATHGLDG